MRVTVTGGPASPQGVDVLRPVGITQPQIAGAITAAAVLVALLTLRAFARQRSVPGRGVLLWLISTRDGTASLSQLQIMLWTFVVGASAMYVMALSGGLIQITNSTLVLLGIAGLATIGAQINAAQGGSSPSPASSMTLPGPVPRVVVVGEPSDTEVRLAWTAPVTGGPVSGYAVRYRQTTAAGAPGAAWIAVAEQITLPHHTVAGLSPGQRYELQVLAVNPAGAGPAASLDTPVQTAPAPEAIPNAPGPVLGLRMDQRPTISALMLTWSPAVGGPTAYHLRYRPHDTASPWVDTVPTAATAATLTGLAPGTSYDVRVAASNAAGIGPWSSPITLRTARSPEWADLVVTGDGRGEVDVTRVQVLFFTVVTALFVILTVATTYTIPEIPTGFMILMGISNGLYVGAKFVPSN